MNQLQRLQAYWWEVRDGYLACRDPEYVQGIVLSLFRDVRKRIASLDKKYSSPESAEIERRIEELRRLVALFHLSESREKKKDEPSQKSQKDLRHKSILYLHARQRLEEQLSVINDVHTKSGKQE